jgi:hypothetical protein
LVATLLVLIVLVVTAESAAQSATLPARWDVAAETGVFANHPRDQSLIESYEDWYSSPVLGLTAGRYLTSHVKVEAELQLTTRGRRYGQRLVDVPGLGVRPFGVEQMTRTNSASTVLVWQFFDNQWVHPFVMAGVSIDFDRVTVYRWPQSYYVGDPRDVGSQSVVAPGGDEDLGTVTTGRGLIGGGAKFYVSPRAFFRADTRIAIASGPSGHVALRFGFGVDF